MVSCLSTGSGRVLLSNFLGKIGTVFRAFCPRDRANCPRRDQSRLTWVASRYPENQVRMSCGSRTSGRQYRRSGVAQPLQKGEMSCGLVAIAMEEVAVIAETGTGELERRLEALERLSREMEGRHRRWRRLGVGLIGCAVVAGLAGAASQKPVSLEAREFVLRDETGAMRAALAVRPDGTPGFGLFDKSGRMRLSFELDADGRPGLNLHDDEGTLRAAVAMRPDGTPGVGLFGAKGQVRASARRRPRRLVGLQRLRRSRDSPRRGRDPPRHHPGRRPVRRQGPRPPLGRDRRRPQAPATTEGKSGKK